MPPLNYPFSHDRQPKKKKKKKKKKKEPLNTTPFARMSLQRAPPLPGSQSLCMTLLKPAPGRCTAAIDKSRHIRFFLASVASRPGYCRVSLSQHQPRALSGLASPTTPSSARTNQSPVFLPAEGQFRLSSTSKKPSTLQAKGFFSTMPARRQGDSAAGGEKQRPPKKPPAVLRPSSRYDSTCKRGTCAP